MRQEDLLEEKIQKFLERKESEYPELKESIDSIIHELSPRHHVSHFHVSLGDTAKSKKTRHVHNSRLGGMRYAG